MPAADDILIDRAEQDFDTGLAHARAEIKAKHGRIAGAALDAILMGAVNALHVKAQMHDDVRFLLTLAHRVNAGEDPAALAQEHIARVLRVRQKMHFIARDDDPDFQVIVSIARDNMAKRLPDLGRMAAVKDPADYDSLVRAAFPDRAEVDRLVDENAAFVRDMIAHLEKHPHVLRIPQGSVPKVAQMARDMVDWKVADVRRGVDEIYHKAR